MSIDIQKYPNLRGVVERSPKCADCGTELIRHDRSMLSDAWWECIGPGCDAGALTDAEMDNRLQSDAEAANERLLVRHQQ